MTSGKTLKRRALTVPGLFALAVVLTITAPVWLLIGLVLDGARLRFRLPLIRLLAFGTCWAWLEVVGVMVAFGLWITFQRDNERAHYALQRWWAGHLLSALRVTCGIRVEVDAVEVFEPGPVLLFVRHASLADSLVTAHVVVSLARMHPRFVLKRELLVDPCLDVVGGRVPNYFLDRGTNDSAPELLALGHLVADMGPLDVGIIFPEGTRANTAKRQSALARIAERDSDRAARLSGLQHLLPPRPGGAQAMIDGAPEVDVVLAWHIGFEGLDTFAGILKALGHRLQPIRFVARRVPSDRVPRGDAFAGWLDEQWLRMDNEVDQALAARNSPNSFAGRGAGRGGDGN
jgi:1-acyl-sn-glycerol-3-phosphate acyltransferase